MQVPATLLEEAHTIARDGHLLCIERCQSICEEPGKEYALLLPGEDLFIARRLGLEHNPFTQVSIDNYTVGAVGINEICQFLQGKRCLIQHFKPLDCLLFPLYPQLYQEAGKPFLRFLVVTYCPLKDALSQEFCHRMARAWRKVALSIPKSWWDFYWQVVPKSPYEIVKGFQRISLIEQEEEEDV